MLTDSNVFKLLGELKEPSLPAEPEALSDPKAVVNEILTELGADLRKLRDFQAFFGANVDFAQLRRLSSFRTVEQELRAAVRSLAP